MRADQKIAILSLALLAGCGGHSVNTDAFSFDAITLSNLHNLSIFPEKESVPAYKYPVDSTHLRTLAGGFQFNPDTEKVFSHITIAFKHSFPRNGRLIARFHTPRGTRITRQNVSNLDLEHGRITLRSTESTGWDIGNYPVVIEVYDNTVLVDKLEQNLVLEVNLEERADAFRDRQIEKSKKEY